MDASTKVPLNLLKYLPPTNIIGPAEVGVKTRSKMEHLVNFACYVSLVEPKNVSEALEDENWINAMQEELNEFRRQKVWTLVPRPSGTNIIGTKWIFKNKSDEFCTVVRNKARLVAQGYSQIEGVDFDETFAPVARLESVRLLLKIACYFQLKLYQMDVKSLFFNGLAISKKKCTSNNLKGLLTHTLLIMYIA